MQIIVERFHNCKDGNDYLEVSIDTKEQHILLMSPTQGCASRHTKQPL